MMASFSTDELGEQRKWNASDVEDGIRTLASRRAWTLPPMDLSTIGTPNNKGNQVAEGDATDSTDDGKSSWPSSPSGRSSRTNSVVPSPIRSSLSSIGSILDSPKSKLVIPGHLDVEGSMRRHWLEPLASPAGVEATPDSRRATKEKPASHAAKGSIAGRRSLSKETTSGRMDSTLGSRRATKEKLASLAAKGLTAGGRSPSKESTSTATPGSRRATKEKPSSHAAEGSIAGGRSLCKEPTPGRVEATPGSRRATKEEPAGHAANGSRSGGRSPSKEQTSAGSPRGATVRLTLDSSFSRWHREKIEGPPKAEIEAKKDDASKTSQGAASVQRLSQTVISVNRVGGNISRKMPLEVIVELLKPGEVHAYARETGLSPAEVQEEWSSFARMPKTVVPGVITKASFASLLRRKCHLSHDCDIPGYLWPSRSSLDSTGFIDFNDYLLWWNSVKYSEEAMVSDPKEKLLRQAAREAGLSLREVEDIAQVFDSFDVDDSGTICQSEFKEVLKKVMLLAVNVPERAD
eukprot:TRINITY_DN6037_c0_g2_i1.p1 TRINITY_DN6037_c0_g2~~TRINITY_DN6037_c0_g2_i1.p1  ORF type:complete len:520 (-),score=58.12 TRINITY_DN6037_c0_g2_i1:72-1631(-)